MRHWIFILLFVAVALHAAPSVARDKHEHDCKHADNHGYLLLSQQAPAWNNHNRRRPSGLLRYEREAPTFNLRLHAYGLQRQQDYTLIYFPDPFPGDQLICIASTTTNRGGALSLAERVELNTSLPAAFDDNHPDGARLRLVLAEDVDCDLRRMLTWQPHAYLFDKWLIQYTDTDTDNAGGETGLLLVYSDLNALTELHCYGLHPWSDAGERHGGIDLKPPYRDLVGTSIMRKEEVVAPAAGVVDWIVKGTTGAGAESLIVILKMNTYWYAVLVFEPQSLDSEILLEQERSIDVQEGQQVNRGERIGDLVVGKVIQDRYPHIHFSLLYKNPDESIQDLFDDPDSILRSDGNALPPATGPGSPWEPENLGIPSTFFCPYVYSVPEAQQAMDSVPKFSVNGDLCSCVCAYNSQDGDCGVCPPQ